MTKKEARAKYKLLRNSLSDAETEAKSLDIANRVNAMDIWNREYFHVFLPIAGKREVDTEVLLHMIAGRDKEAVVSKSDFDMRHMRHFLLTEETILRTNEYGIPEPDSGEELPVKKIDVVFVPLLAYDKKGNRVGYGKGFYDVFLSQCRADVIKIGLSFFGPEDEIIDASVLDVRLDFCVTPDDVYRFSPSPDGSGSLFI